MSGKYFEVEEGSSLRVRWGEVLANNVPVAAAGSVESGRIGAFGTVSVFLTVSAASTIDVYVRAPSGVYYKASSWNATVPGSNVVSVATAGQGIKVVSSAAINWTVEYQTA